ncbi:MAG: hypothetical protein INR65_07765 [Gluconacetobacter diazotrophicus]|nr:hypothetical protein [Gluconacetobacter diazotrophicus]
MLPQTPDGGIFDGTATTSSNTTDRLLNGLNYLYDAAGGYVGFEPNGSGNTGSTFTEELAAGNTITLPDGFSSTIPTVLCDPTTFSEAGSATFSGAFSGSAPLTLTGGGSFTFSGGGSMSGGLTVGNASLGIDGTLDSGQATVSGKVTLPAATAAGAERWNITGGLDAAGGVVTVGAVAELGATGGVTVEKGGSLFLSQAASVTGNLTLNDGHLYSQTGTAEAGSVSLAGAVILGGLSDTIDLGLDNSARSGPSVRGSVAGRFAGATADEHRGRASAPRWRPIGDPAAEDGAANGAEYQLTH